MQLQLVRRHLALDRMLQRNQIRVLQLDPNPMQAEQLRLQLVLAQIHLELIP